MKILHLSDLHLGKSIYGIQLALSGDQQFLIDNIIEAVSELKPDAVVISGDVYDRSNPPEAAVGLLEQLLNRLMNFKVPVFIISGNHDSVKRLSYLNLTLKEHNVHICDELGSELQSVTLKDEFGDITFWLLPFAYPAMISQVLEDPDLKYKDYDAAIRAYLDKQNIDYSKRNILIAHQNVVKNGKEAKRGGSETLVGGMGGIESDAFANFDYTALGHIHAGYQTDEGVRYCGTPMCYHFDETRQKEKGGLLVEIGAKGVGLKAEKIVFKPLHPMVVIKGTLDEVKELLGELKGGEYLKIVLTDLKGDHQAYSLFNALAEEAGASLLELTSDYEFKTGPFAQIDGSNAEETPADALFEEFYFSRFGEPLDDKDKKLISYLSVLLNQQDFDGVEDVDKAAGRLLDFAREELDK